MRETPKFTTPAPDLISYSGLTLAEIRQVQRRIGQGELNRMVSGVGTPKQRLAMAA